jgi:predicted DsbA family dithiol-disulfide isomerase
MSQNGGDTVSQRGRVIQLRIWADVACPWCWIGERRLSRALASRPDLNVQRVWQPFELQPDLPPEGMAWEEFLDAKFDGAERAQPFLDHVAKVGREAGLELRFDRIRRAPNTRRAHALIVAGESEELDWQMAERLFQAHFNEGEDLSDSAVLERLGREVGLDEALVAKALDADDYRTRIHSSQAEAREREVHGVPFFLIEGRTRLSGAQPPEVFLQVLDSLPEGEERRRA